MSMVAPFRRVEHAPVLLVFGNHAARIASMIRVRPGLLERIAFAPRSAIHAVGAFLHIAAEADGDDAEVAEVLECSDPRDLLRMAIPSAPPRLYRALSRAGNRVRDRDFYERLGGLCVGPMADTLLSGPALNEASLARAEAILKMDPAIQSLPSALLRQTSRRLEALDTMVKFLRAHDAFDGDFHLPPKAGMPAVFRRLQKALDQVAAPLSFSFLPPFRTIRNTAELRAIGTKLNNCVRNFRSFGTDQFFDLLDGSTVFVARDEPPMLASICRVGPGVFRFSELAGPDNADVNEDMRAEFVDGLVEAGVKLVAQSPARAMSSLCQGLGKLEDQGDDLDEDLAA